MKVSPVVIKEDGALVAVALVAVAVLVSLDQEPAVAV
jgi:hypothetical protein